MNNKSYRTPYANLAAAIIDSGIKEHDEYFLNSNWCELLRSLCALDDEIYGFSNELDRYKNHLKDI